MTRKSILKNTKFLDIVLPKKESVVDFLLSK